MGRRTCSAPVVALRIGLIAVALAVAGCDDRAEVQARYARGVELLAAGKLEDAGAAFRSALELDNTHVPSRLQLARLADERGDWLQAVEGYGEAIAIDPDQIEARVRIAHLMIAAKDYAAAESYARQAFELAPENADVLAALASVDAGTGNVGQALDWANRALAIDARNRTARLVRAHLAADAGETVAALELLDALLAEAPADMEANLVKSRLLNQAGREGALRDHLTQMARLFPDPWIKTWLAYLRERAGDISGAHAMLRALSEEKPGDVEAARAVIDLVHRAHGAEAARHEFSSRIAAADANAARQLRLELAAFEEAEGRPEEAANVLSALIRDAPDSAEANAARVRIARRHLAAGNHEEARRIVDTVLAADPRRPEALGLRAALLLDQGKAEEAIEVLRAGLAEAPNDVDLSLMLARAYHRAGRQELAQDRFATAIRMSDFDLEVVTAYADFLAESEATSAAVYLLEAAAKKHPENEDIRAKLDAVRSRSAVE